MRNQSRFPWNQARNQPNPPAPPTFTTYDVIFEGNHGEIKEKSRTPNCSLRPLAMAECPAHNGSNKVRTRTLRKGGEPCVEENVTSLTCLSKTNMHCTSWFSTLVFHLMPTFSQVEDGKCASECPASAENDQINPHNMVWISLRSILLAYCDY